MDTHDQTVQDLEDLFRQAVERANREIDSESSRSRRQARLDQWESYLTTVIRPSYKAAYEAVRSNHSMPEERKSDLLRRLGQITRGMVCERSRLEGLVRGSAPTSHQAGGAFPPPSNCNLQVQEKARQALALALQGFDEAAVSAPGELLGAWVSRLERLVNEAVGQAEQVLRDSGAEYREFLETLRKETRLRLAQAMDKRDRRADEAARAAVEKLTQAYTARLGELPSTCPSDPETLVDNLVRWAQQELESAQAILRNQGIALDLTSHLRSFQRSAKAKLGDYKGWWKRPPVFEKVTLSDLDPRVTTEPGGPGVYVKFYSNGHLKEAIGNGGTLKVAANKPQARYEDSANVAEFRPDGTIEEYGGRYEREIRARITFADWVIERVTEMVEAPREWSL